MARFRAKQDKADKDATAAVGEHVKRSQASFGVAKASSEQMAGVGMFLQLVSILLAVPTLTVQAFGLLQGANEVIERLSINKLILLFYFIWPYASCHPFLFLFLSRLTHGDRAQRNGPAQSSKNSSDAPASCYHVKGKHC